MTALLTPPRLTDNAFGRTFTQRFGKPSARVAIGITVAWLPSPLGPLVVGATSEGVCLLEFGDPRRLEPQLAALSRRFKLPVTSGKHEHLRLLESELAAYFAGQLRDFTTPLVVRGTAFQERVWQGLRRIPYGATCSYEELALAIGAPRAQRAVGRANGLNRIAIVIPCHRVINKDGNLGGYGGGLAHKEHLLSLERGILYPPKLEFCARFFRHA